MAIEGTPSITSPSENNILQSFSDATAGRSQQLYWAMATTDSTGTNYVLVRDSGTSRPVLTPWATETNFDITINKPTIIAGIAVVDFSSTHTGGDHLIGTINIIHYDGATETVIGTVTTETNTGGLIKMKVKINVTRKLFGIGHTLRLNFVKTAGGSGQLEHDPATAGKELKLWLPIVNLE